MTGDFYGEVTLGKKVFLQPVTVGSAQAANC